MEAKTLLEVRDQHANPTLGWMVPLEVLSGKAVFQHNIAMNIPISLYHRRRFSPEVIAHAVDEKWGRTYLIWKISTSP